MDESTPNNPYETPLTPPAKPPIGPDDSSDKDARQMAMLAHLLGALLGFLGPLIIWLIKKDESRFVDDQGKEALNFHLTLLIAYVVVGVISVVTCGVGAVLYPVVLVLQIVYGIIGAMKANNGEYYRYPMTFRMVT